MAGPLPEPQTGDPGAEWISTLARRLVGHAQAAVASGSAGTAMSAPFGLTFIEPALAGLPSLNVPPFSPPTGSMPTGGMSHGNVPPAGVSGTSVPAGVVPAGKITLGNTAPGHLPSGHLPSGMGAAVERPSAPSPFGEVPRPSAALPVVNPWFAQLLRPAPGMSPIAGHTRDATTPAPPPVGPSTLAPPSMGQIPGGFPPEAAPAVVSPSMSPRSMAPPAMFPPAMSPATSSPTGSQSQHSGLSEFVRQVRSAGCASQGRGIHGLLDPAVFNPEFGRTLASHSGARGFNVEAVRRDFPILEQRVNGQPLAWLDNAATTQKPREVIEALSVFYSRDNSNIHRAAHTLAARATDAYEKARDKVRRFLGAGRVEEIVFVRGTTEGINLVAQTFGRKYLQPGDEIILSELEHHANIVPWQFVARERGATIRVIPVNDRGEVLLTEYERLLGPRTRLVGLTHASNSLGTLLPIAQMTEMAHRHGARVLIDGAQTVAHIPVDVQRDGFDFFVFSGHKVFGPTGIGAVFAKAEILRDLPPWQGGGNMIREVTFEETTFADPPARLEAGTPNIADAVGLGVALDYVARLGLPQIAAYEHELLEYATGRLLQVPGLQLIGTAREKIGVLSFVLPNRSPEEVGRLLDQHGIAVRAGHHCAQPSLRRFGLKATVRPSLSIYNTREEVDRMVTALQRFR